MEATAKATLLVADGDPDEGAVDGDAVDRDAVDEGAVNGDAVEEGAVEGAVNGDAVKEGAVDGHAVDGDAVNEGAADGDAANGDPVDDGAVDGVVLFLQEYVKDDTNVDPSKRMNFIFMLALQNIEEFDVRETVPYSEFVERTGFKKHFTFTKKTVVQELKRRSPAAKPNAKNQSSQ